MKSHSKCANAQAITCVTTDARQSAQCGPTDIRVVSKLQGASTFSVSNANTYFEYRCVTKPTLISVTPDKAASGSILKIQIMGPVGQVLTVKVGSVACDLVEEEESASETASVSSRFREQETRNIEVQPFWEQYQNLPRPHRHTLGSGSSSSSGSGSSSSSSGGSGSGSSRRSSSSRRSRRSRRESGGTRPTGDTGEQASPLAALVCAPCRVDEERSLVQLRPHGPWLTQRPQGGGAVAGSKCPLHSAPARLLRLLRARLAAPGSSVLPGRGRPTGRPAAASAARASRVQSRPFHCV